MRFRKAGEDHVSVSRPIPKYGLENAKTLEEDGVQGGVGDRTCGVGERTGWSISTRSGSSNSHSI